MSKFPTKKLKNLNEEQRLIFIRKWFKENFIYNESIKKSIIIKTHDDKRVVFADMEDCHAFTKENNITGDREIDYVRVRYLHLIKETIKLKNNPLIKDVFDKITKQNRRFYYDTKRNYFLVLKRLKGGDFHYISSYFIQSHTERLKRWRFMLDP
jgi:hypothetical protein